MLNTQVKVSGPLFTGAARAAVDDWLEDAVDAVAEEGVQDVQSELDGVLRHPTGFYRSRIRTSNLDRHRDLVTDGGVIYGPWLAGTSSRNQTTSFRGYDHWRRATQRLDQRADRIAESKLGPHLRAMNG